MSSIVLDACWWIAVPCVFNRSAVPAIIAEVVALIASILSRTIFWWASASATVTATWSALTVTSIARSTPRISSRLLRMMISMARTPCWLTASCCCRSSVRWRQREQDVLLDELAAWVVGADLGGELVDDDRIERLSHAI